jgi:putative ABC transport system permease protein
MPIASERKLSVSLLLSRFVRDVSFGLRTLRKDRTFTVLAVFALALGIGAMTVIFSVIDNVLLEPFPYRDAQRLTKFYIHNPARPDAIGRANYAMPEYRAFRERNHVFEDLIASEGTELLYSDAQGTKIFSGYNTTANTFDFLGVAPLLGRPMAASDGDPGAPPVAVMSFRAWIREFNSDPNIVGKQLTLNDRPTTIIAVMPPRFQLYDGDFWLPLTTETDQTSVSILARVKPGISMTTVAADVDAISRDLQRIYPQNFQAKFSIIAVTLVDRVVRRFRPLLYALLAAVTMLLLIACSNVANLLLVRATARAHEIAIRASLGASRARLTVQLLSESLVLGALGCLAGCGFAYAGIRGIAAAIPRDIFPNEAVIVLNGRVLAFAVALALVTTLISGLAPALHAVGLDLHEQMKRMGKGSIGGGVRSRLRLTFVVAQVALSVVLLAGAGLLLRTMFAFESQEMGFTSDHVLTARVAFPRTRPQTPEQRQQFVREVLQRISALPAVESAAQAVSAPPFDGVRMEVTLPGDAQAEKVRIAVQPSSADLFKTLGLKLQRGRLLTAAEIDAARRLIVVNETLARQFFPNEDALGRTLKMDSLERMGDVPPDTQFEIVGIVADFKNDGVDQRPLSEAFLPYTIPSRLEHTLLVRTRVEPASMLLPIRRAVQAVDPAVALTLPETLDSRLARQVYAQPRFASLVMGLFAAIGLVLAAIGIFSVMAYTVSLQTAEIGVRMALGAQRGTVMTMVLKHGLSIIAIGIIVGELVSLAVMRLLQNQLWGVSAYDPLTLAGVVAVLVMVGVAACAIPARRAMLVDPIVALRHD